MSYKSDLLDRLKSPRYCAAYLSAALADSSEAFLVALRDVAEAQRGLTQLASAAKVNRENLYRMLSEDGNPRLSSLSAIMEALGLRLSVELSEAKSTAVEPRAAARTRTETSRVTGRHY
jgi:probable addiction module antidote protein